MIVQQGRNVLPDHAQASRHSQMHDDRAGVEPEQQIFGAPFDAPHDFTLDLGFEAARDGPAQAAFAHGERDYAPANEDWGDAPARRLYFGQLGQSPAPT